MVLVYCVFDKCGNQRKKNSKISFFSFPKEEGLLQKWLNFVNKHNPNHLDEDMLERDKMKICHLHFEKRQVQTKSNNDRALVRNSVPQCPPGIVDKGHMVKKSKAKKKSKKSKSSGSVKSNKSSEESPSKSKSVQPTLEGNPLYHTINGYVVDLRIAAQQETFRLPNGKLIQVRRQPKKGSDSATQSELIVAAVSSPTNSTEKSNPTLQDSDRSSSPPVTTTPSSSARGNLEPPIILNKVHTEKASKTYSNRRSLNQPPRTSPSFRSGPLPTRPVTAPVIAPPSLTTLQTLMHKTYPDNPFGNHLKEFENRLISTAELSLHIVSKINNFLHSNPYRNAENTTNLKDLYHHLAYILKYAVDRFKGLEDHCVKDIQQMGFTKQSDLGPLSDEKTPPNPNQTQNTTEKTETAVTEAETEADKEEDDDCAIIEQRTDIIEVDSDEDDESGEEQESDDQTAESTGITLNKKQLRICSDTESIEPDEASNGSAKVRRKTDNQYHRPIENETHTDDATQIEVVMNEVKETTTIVHDYYYAELSEDEDENDDTVDQTNQGNDEVMDLDDESEGGTHEEEEGTEELIEIIEGDIDLELEEGQEYKVIEVVDGDCEMW